MERVSNGKHCVLVVDDDEDVLLLIQGLLRSQGYIPSISPNGENMMDIITQSRPDLILLDLQMKGLDGGTVCHLLKSNHTTSTIPIIMCSASENVAKVTQECGANGYIRKPFEASQFTRTIEHVLNGA